MEYTLLLVIGILLVRTEPVMAVIDFVFNALPGRK